MYLPNSLLSTLHVVLVDNPGNGSPLSNTSTITCGGNGQNRFYKQVKQVYLK